MFVTVHKVNPRINHLSVVLCFWYFLWVLGSWLWVQDYSAQHQYPAQCHLVKRYVVYNKHITDDYKIEYRMNKTKLPLRITNNAFFEVISFVIRSIRN